MFMCKYINIILPMHSTVTRICYAFCRQKKEQASGLACVMTILIQWDGVYTIFQKQRLKRRISRHNLRKEKGDKSQEQKGKSRQNSLSAQCIHKKISLFTGITSGSQKENTLCCSSSVKVKILKWQHTDKYSYFNRYGYLTSLWISFLIWKMRMTIKPVSYMDAVKIFAKLLAHYSA